MPILELRRLLETEERATYRGCCYLLLFVSLEKLPFFQMKCRLLHNHRALLCEVGVGGGSNEKSGGNNWPLRAIMLHPSSARIAPEARQTSTTRVIQV